MASRLLLSRRVSSIWSPRLWKFQSWELLRYFVVRWFRTAGFANSTVNHEILSDPHYSMLSKKSKELRAVSWSVVLCSPPAAYIVIHDEYPVSQGASKNRQPHSHPNPVMPFREKNANRNWFKRRTLLGVKGNFSVYSRACKSNFCFNAAFACGCWDMAIIFDVYLSQPLRDTCCMCCCTKHELDAVTIVTIARHINTFFLMCSNA